MLIGAESLIRENESFSKTILACLSGGLDSRGKNANKSRDTATLRVTEGNSADGNSLAFNFSVADPDPHGSVPVTFSWIRIRNYSSGSSKK